MPLWPTALPFTTDYDSAEDPPGSIDPLGTLSCAERLADLLFPGFTARMYRLRLLTMAVVAAAVAERVADVAEDGDGARLPARLAFERLVTAALVRQRVQGVLAPLATRRLPGSHLAQQALSAKEPLTPANFLRGQAVNGASGVIMRLARNLRLLDDRGAITGLGRELLLTWANEQRLRGVLDEPGDSQRSGAQWMRDVAKAASTNVSDGIWPGPGQNLWDRLAGPLRLDGADVGERAFLRTQLMSGSPVRARMLELLSELNVGRSVALGQFLLRTNRRTRTRTAPTAGEGDLGVHQEDPEDARARRGGLPAAPSELRCDLRSLGEASHEEDQTRCAGGPWMAGRLRCRFP